MYLIYILIVSNLFCNENKSLIESSNVGSTILTNSELNYMVGYNVQFYSGFEWWVSENYYIQGFIAPRIKSLKNSIYHQISLGSIFFSRKNYEGIVEIGLNRQRFNFDGDSNWRQFSISNKYKYKPIIIDFILTQFSFDKISTLLYSISFTYLTAKMHQLSCVMSIDEFYNSYSSFNLSINI